MDVKFFPLLLLTVCEETGQRAATEASVYFKIAHMPLGISQEQRGDGAGTSVFRHRAFECFTPS